MIHNTAIIDPKAKIDKDVSIGAYSIIGADVQIGSKTIIQPHVNIVGDTLIGKNNKIYSFASIGNDPQDLKYKNEKTKLVIGDYNKIREYVTINPGTVGGGGLTKVGNNCLFTALVSGLIRVPIPPASIIPFFIILLIPFFFHTFFLKIVSKIVYY